MKLNIGFCHESLGLCLGPVGIGLDRFLTSKSLSRSLSKIIVREMRKIIGMNDIGPVTRGNNSAF